MAQTSAEDSTIAGLGLPASHRLVRQLLALQKWCKSHDWFAKQYGKLEESAAEEWTSPANSGSDRWHVYGLDCEMVFTKRTGKEEKEAQTLARVSLVRCFVGSDSMVAEDEEAKLRFETVLDEHVKIDAGREVVDYVTEVSGIEAYHLEQATWSREEVKSKLKALLGENSLLLGHALYSDFEALQYYHPRFIDSAFLFNIRDWPGYSLSLKDGLEFTMKVLKQDQDMQKSERTRFQAHGEAHDSVIDARVAVQVVVDCLMIQRQATESMGFPITLPELPRRFRKRITFASIPRECGTDAVENTIETVLGTLEGGIAERGYSVKSPKFKKLKDERVVASIAVDFETEGLAEAFFKALPTASIKTASSDTPLPSHPKGWPGKKGQQCKLCLIQDKSNSSSYTCEAMSYIPFPIQHEATVAVERKNLGKVYGKFGRTINLIQRCSGTRITTLPKAHSDNFKIEASSQADLDKARYMITLAAQGSYS